MEHTNTPPNEPRPSLEEELAFLDDPVQMALYKEECEREARDIIHRKQMEDHEKALKDIVFSLEAARIDTNTRNPVDFAEMLSVNARALNAAFEFYLSKAHLSPEPDKKIKLAFAAQGLLVRSIDSWKRLSDFEIGGTK